MLSFRFAALATASLLLVGCGGSDEPSSSPTSPSSVTASDTSSPSVTAEPTEPTKEPSDQPTKEDSGVESGATVAKEPFCDALDVDDVAELLGLDQAELLVEVEPGDEIQADPSAPGVAAKEWTCTIGASTGSSIAATWTIRDGRAGSNDPNARMKTLQGTLGTKSCTSVTDDALGAGTEGVDCGGQAGSSGFTLAARAIVIDHTQLECYLASTDAGDLPALSEAAPQLCPMLLDAVVQ